MQPLLHLPKSQQSWGFIIGDFDAGPHGKTGDFDESVMLDWPELARITPLLMELKACRGDHNVWNLNEKKDSQWFVEAVNDAGVSVLKPVRYSLRHGGTSQDILSRRKCLTALEKRGRWKSDPSVRRYEKAARALKEGHRLPSQVRKDGLLIQKNFVSFMLDRPAVPRPPGA